MFNNITPRPGGTCRNPPILDCAKFATCRQTLSLLPMKSSKMCYFYCIGEREGSWVFVIVLTRFCNSLYRKSCNRYNFIILLRVCKFSRHSQVSQQMRWIKEKVGPRGVCNFLWTTPYKKSRLH